MIRRTTLILTLVLAACDGQSFAFGPEAGVLQFDPAMIGFSRDASTVMRDGGADDSGAPGIPELDLTLKLLADAPSYDARVAQETGSSLAFTASSWGGMGYVVTTMSTNSAGYTILGFRPAGSTTTYDVRMAQETGSTLDFTASSWGSMGYVVTAMVSNSAGYTILGFRPTGSTTTYDVQVAQTTGSGLQSTASSWAGTGYVVTAMTSNGAGYTVLGFRPTGSTTSYEAQTAQPTGSALGSTITAWGTEGYTATAMVTGDFVPYTVLGFRRTASGRTFATQMAQTTGSGLDATATAWGSDGYIVNAMVSNSAGYTILGFDPSE